MSSPPASAGRGVLSYDEMIYTCQSKDTWLSVSKRFYHTEAYAAALQLYNRTHPQATNRSMTAEGAMTIGEPVYVPSTSLLHERYGSHIAAPKPDGRP
jgi:hypothetical protein